MFTDLAMWVGYLVLLPIVFLLCLVGLVAGFILLFFMYDWFRNLIRYSFSLSNWWESEWGLFGGGANVYPIADTPPKKMLPPPPPLDMKVEEMSAPVFGGD
jgi:hypothetical protein